MIRGFVSLWVGMLFGLATGSLLSWQRSRSSFEQLLIAGVSTLAFGCLIFIFYSPPHIQLSKIKEHFQPQRLRSAAASAKNNLRQFLLEHWPGLLLSMIFFIVLTIMAFQLNRPELDTTDNLLDADNSTWMRRIAWAGGAQFEMRAPHPFAYFIFRPLGWAASLFFREPFLAALFLNTFAGALCVFLMWILIRQRLHDKTYALLAAALLGLSTSHLWFGSIIESYIFSAAALLAFFILSGTKKKSDPSLLIASLLSFGITLTNIVQIFIGYLFAYPKIKNILRFFIIVISFAVILTLIHSAWFPSAKIFFLPSEARSEEEFSISLFREPAWRAAGRIILVARSMLLYTVIAPVPFVYTEEVGGSFPRFNFFHIAPGEYAFSSYAGLGNVLVFYWAALLLSTGILFARRIIRARRLDMTAAFALCLLFNFVLHLQYGYEPFLYSPDWAYALVAFTVLSFGEYAEKRWLHALLLGFTILLAINQWQFFKFVFDTISPYLK